MRVAKGNSNSLLEACYLENVNLVNNGKACWLGHIKNIVLNTLGCQGALDNEGSTHPKSLLRKLHTSIKNIYINHWKKYITRTGTNNGNGNKLRTYMTSKTEFRQQGYLDHVETLDDRKYLARLRTSSHNLKIETGRHA